MQGDFRLWLEIDGKWEEYPCRKFESSEAGYNFGRQLRVPYKVLPAHEVVPRELAAQAA